MKSTIIVILFLTFNYFILSDSANSRETKNISSLTFYNLENNRKNISNYKGKPIIVHFWATWCKPCLAELPLLADFYNRRKNDFHIIPIVYMDNKDNNQIIEILKNIKSNDLPFYRADNKSDYNEIIGYNINALPLSLSLDNNGNIMDIKTGMVKWDNF